MNGAPTQTPSTPIAEALFGNGDTQVFAVLDGASVPGLPMLLYQHKPEHCCLYRGELEPDMATVAPYLVRLKAESKFTELVFTEGWGTHWGSFLVSSVTL